jgi:hypothetical protein
MPHLLTIGGAILLAGGVTPALAQQTLTFGNAQPPLTLPLSDASTVFFEDNGNVIAQCRLDANNQCMGLAPGTCPVPPSVALTAGEFSQVPSGGLYQPGTTLKLFPAVSGAEICRRFSDAVTPPTEWDGLVEADLNAPVTIALSVPYSTYAFTLKCFGGGGAQTSSTITLRTSGDDVPGPCTSTQFAPVGFTRDLTYDELTDLPTFAGLTLSPFPNTGASLGGFVIPTGRWAALRFTVPANPAAFEGLLKRFSWLESSNGNEANLSTTYLTISECPGDFRAPDAFAAPAADPTFARGCRNLRPSQALTAMGYAVSPMAVPSTATTCNLRYGGSYYFNMILASPYDGGGIVPGESSCANQSATQCGIRLEAH